MSMPWVPLFNAFNHQAPVDDATEEFFVERPNAVASAALRRLQFKPNDRIVFCGSIGSGKSSELAFLGRRLRNQRAVVGLDIFRSVNNIRGLEPAEVLLLIGLAVGRTAEEIYGFKVPADRREALTDAYRGLIPEGTAVSIDWPTLLKGVALSVTAAKLGDVGRAVGAAAEALGAVRPTLGGTTRTVSAEIDPDVGRLIDAVNGLFTWFETEIGARALGNPVAPFLLVDGLDKLEADQLPLIRALFCTNLLARVDVGAVYAAPIMLMLETEWSSAAAWFQRERLTNLVIRAPELADVVVTPALIEQGRGALRSLIERRIRSLQLGIDDLFTPDALDEIIDASGGLLRTFVHLVNAAIVEAADSNRITGEHARRASHQLSQEYEVTMNTRRLQELIHVRDHGMPSGNPESMSLMTGNYVLPYRNGRTWWTPAPLVGRLLPQGRPLTSGRAATSN